MSPAGVGWSPARTASDSATEERKNAGLLAVEFEDGHGGELRRDPTLVPEPDDCLSEIDPSLECVDGGDHPA